MSKTKKISLKKSSATKILQTKAPSKTTKKSYDEIENKVLYQMESVSLDLHRL